MHFLLFFSDNFVLKKFPTSSISYFLLITLMQAIDALITPDSESVK